MPLKRVALELDAEISRLAIATGAANTVALRADRKALAGQHRRARHRRVAARGRRRRRRERGVARRGWHGAGSGGGPDARSGPPAVDSAGARSCRARRSCARPPAGSASTSTSSAGFPTANSRRRTSSSPRCRPRAADPLRRDRLAAADGRAGRHLRPVADRADRHRHPAPGCRVVSGLDVLLHQAVRQVTLMTGRPGPVEAMRRRSLAAEPCAGRGRSGARGPRNPPLTTRMRSRNRISRTQSFIRWCGVGHPSLSRLRREY